MDKKGQSVFQDFVVFLFLVVALIVIAIFASVTAPFLILQVSANNITGGMGLVAEYWNVLLVGVLLFVGLILVFSSRGGTQ